MILIFRAIESYFQYNIGFRIWTFRPKYNHLWRRISSYYLKHLDNLFENIATRLTKGNIFAMLVMYDSQTIESPTINLCVNAPMNIWREL